MIHRVTALVRFILFWTFYQTPLMNYRSYSQPSKVGYRGWYNLGGKCLVFVRLDGSNLYRW